MYNIYILGTHFKRFVRHTSYLTELRTHDIIKHYPRITIVPYRNKKEPLFGYIFLIKKNT